ncbi:MAG: SpoIIE family protein phosphatase [Gemmatales bacterium]|nr:SpoIIE family protein phosphatase [Gemmatales bacterium]MDW7995707.1 SpoIIE family protein phosphatase [Gemmatales bacterium]
MATNWTMRVEEVMVRPPITVSPQAHACEAIRRMAEQRVGAVLVAEGEKLLGIFTERDVLRLLASSADRAWLDRPVRELMTTNPWTISPQATWEQARSLMETVHVRHVPVVDEGRLVGLVSARDLLDSYTEHLHRQIEARTQELRQAHRRLEERDQEIRLHMSVAGRIQSRLLPETPPKFPDLHFATYYAPVEPLGGDYYDFATVEDRYVGVLIADATGHSIPAALVAIMTHAAFSAGARKAYQPAQLLDHMNRYLHGLTEEHFVTAFYGVVDRQAGQFIYSNAGHPKPWIYRARTQTCEALEGHQLMLGVVADGQYSEHRLALEPGDRILLYTDGVTEARNERGEHFGADRIHQFLRQYGNTSATNLAQSLAEQLRAFRGPLPQADDITIVVAAWH